MGTNFYLRRIPTKERKSGLYKILSDVQSSLDQMKKMIDDNDYKAVTTMLDEFGTDFEKETEALEERVHLGKRSYGWQFLWQYYGGKYYDDNFESIKKFISQPGYEIIDEYGEIFTVDQFLNDEIGHIIYKTVDLFDLPSYHKYQREHGERVYQFGRSEEFTSKDGLRFCRCDFS